MGYGPVEETGDRYGWLYPCHASLFVPAIKRGPIHSVANLHTPHSRRSLLDTNLASSYTSPNYGLIYQLLLRWFLIKQYIEY